MQVLFAYRDMHQIHGYFDSGYTRKRERRSSEFDARYPDYSQTPLIFAASSRIFGRCPSSIRQICMRKRSESHRLNSHDECKTGPWTKESRRGRHVYFLRNEQPSVRRAFPPVGWHRTVEQPAQMTTVCACEKTVVMVKQPGHLTSMKKDRGAGTRF